MIDTGGIRKHVATGAPLPFSLVFQLCDEIDRLRGEKQTPQGKTVEVRIPVAVEKSGYWRAGPRASAVDLPEYMSDKYVIYWLTATLPVPEEVTVVARVEQMAKEGGAA